jgi:hypothetical protein
MYEVDKDATVKDVVIMGLFGLVGGFVIGVLALIFVLLLS